MYSYLEVRICFWNRYNVASLCRPETSIARTAPTTDVCNVSSSDIELSDSHNIFLTRVLHSCLYRLLLSSVNFHSVRGEQRFEHQGQTMRRKCGNKMPTTCNRCFFTADLIVCPVCGLLLQEPANRTHNPQLHTIPTT
jgi:hypothetical protein